MTSEVFGTGTATLNKDIVMCLMEVMPDKTLVCFVRTCKGVHHLAGPILVERKMVAMYSTISFNTEIATQLAVRIMNNPQIIPYISELRYTHELNIPNSYLVRQLATGPSTQACRNQLVSVTERLLRMTTSEFVDHEPGAPFPDVFAMPLLLLCQNVKKILLIGYDEVLPAYLSLCLRQNHGLLMSQVLPQMPAFQWLELNSIAFIPDVLSDEPLSLTMHELLWLLSPRKLHEFSVRQVAIWQGLENTERFTQIPTSQVKTIRLESCHIIPHHLAELLDYLPNLQFLVLIDTSAFDWCHLWCKERYEVTNPPLWDSMRDFFDNGFECYIVALKHEARYTLAERGLFVQSRILLGETSMYYQHQGIMSQSHFWGVVIRQQDTSTISQPSGIIANEGMISL